MRYFAAVAVALLAVPTFAYAQEQGRPAATSTPVTVTNTPSNPVPAAITTTTVTHVGRRPADHVTLGLAAGSSDTCSSASGWNGFIRRTQDGTFEPFFTVPPGKALILTDFGFYAGKATNATWSVGDLLTVRMGRANDSNTLWQTSITLDSATAAATRVYISEHLTSGIVFRAGQTPCSKVGFGTESQGAGANSNTLSVVHGYLVDD